MFYWFHEMNSHCSLKFERISFLFHMKLMSYDIYLSRVLHANLLFATCSCLDWVQTADLTVWRGGQVVSGTAWIPAGSTNRTRTLSHTWVIAIRNPPTWWLITTSVEASNRTVMLSIYIAGRQEVKSHTVASLILNDSVNHSIVIDY